MEKKETFHLMAVPRHMTRQVIQGGGRFLQLKSKRWKNVKQIQLIQYVDSQNETLHILDPEQSRTYEMFGEEIEENLSLCKMVFLNKENQKIRILAGTSGQSDCEECKKTFQTLSQ